MLSSSTLLAFIGYPMEDDSLYCNTVGSLQYLSLAWTDLAFFVNRVYQFMHKPTKLDWQAVKRILRFLKHTITHDLLLTHNRANTIEVFSMRIEWVAQMIEDPRVFIVRFLVSFIS